MNTLDRDIESSTASALSTPSKPTPGGLFWSFLSIGAFTFGGGYAMLPLIRKSLVEKSGWLQDEEFIDAIAVAQSAPGPIAVNIAVITGYKLNGLRGTLAAVLGATLPSFVILIIVATFFLGLQDNRFVRAALTGMRPAIVALMASAVYDIGKNTIRSKQAAVLSIVAIVLLLVVGLHPVLVIVAAAIAGLAVNSRRVLEQKNNNNGKGHGDNT